MTAFRASARTVDLLGRQQIAGVPTAISELFKNAHDAYAQHARVDFMRPTSTLILRDDGIGMTHDEFVSRWLTLGTDSKAAGASKLPPRPSRAEARPVLGEKGIGRLAIASIGPQALVVSRPDPSAHGGPGVLALLNWTFFEIPGINLDQVPVPTQELPGSAAIPRDAVSRLRQQLVEAAERHAPEKLRTRILEELQLLPDDLHDLLTGLAPLSPEHPSTHGTSFVVVPAQESIAADLDKERGEWGASAIKRTLSGFADTITSNLPPAMTTAFVDHRASDDVVDVIGESEFFTAGEFAIADHHIAGRFDEFGQFQGTVTVFGGKPKPHVVPWTPARGRHTKCGPFEIELAVVQGERTESNLDRQTWVQLTRKMDAIGGLYIYRDGIRVLPYGNADSDFLEIERNRTKKADRYYFSYRRMFGVVTLATPRNGALQEKAGREGFLDNAAYRQFREILMGFFKATAYDFFAPEGGEASDYHETREELRAARAAQEKRDRHKNARRRKYVQQIDEAFDDLAAGTPDREAQAILEQLDKRLGDALVLEDPASAAEAFVTAEIAARTQLQALRSRYRVAAPRGIGLSRTAKNSAAAYLREFARVDSEVFEPTRLLIGETTDARSREFRDVLSRRMHLDRFIDEIGARARAEVAGAAGDVRRVAAEIQAGVADLAQASRRAVDQVIAQAQAEGARFDVSATEELAFAQEQARLEEAILTAASEELELLRALAAQLSTVPLARGDGEDSALTALTISEQDDERRLALEERSDVDLEMATQGLAIQVVNHEFAHSIGAVRASLRRLATWADSNPPLVPVYQDLRASFDHLDGYLRIFTPLQRRLNRRRETITGAQVHTYLESVFRRTLDLQPVEDAAAPELLASEAFLQFEFVGYRSTFYPVFVNLVDNALYWCVQHSSQPAVSLDIRGGRMVVSDNGPGIDPRHQESIFDMGWTLKPGGRGAGLSICRQVLRAESWDLDVTDSSEGAAFALTPPAVE